MNQQTKQQEYDASLAAVAEREYQSDDNKAAKQPRVSEQVSPNKAASAWHNVRRNVYANAAGAVESAAASAPSASQNERNNYQDTPAYKAQMSKLQE